MKKIFFCVILALLLVAPSIHGAGSTIYPWPTNWSLGGLASWAQPLIASGTLPPMASASVGDLFIDNSVATAPVLWIRTTIGWWPISAENLPVDTASVGGDISGTIGTATVSKIQGRPASSTAPTSGQALVWNGSSWAPGTPTVPGSISSGTALPATSSYSVGDLFMVGTQPPLLYRLCDTVYTLSEVQDQIPTMTSNVTPSGTATRSAAMNSFLEAWKCMDKDTGTYWQPTSSASYPHWVGYGFSASQTITSYRIRAGNPAFAPYPPGSWTFEACNPGSAWVVLATESQPTWVNGVPQTFTATNSVAYTYYRLNISANAGATGTLGIYELNLYGSAVATTSIWQEVGLYRSSATPTGTIATGTHWWDQNSNEEKLFDGSNWVSLGEGGTAGEPTADAHIASQTGIHGLSPGQRFLSASETISYSSLSGKPTFGTMASESASSYIPVGSASLFIRSKGEGFASGTALPATSSAVIHDLFILGTGPSRIYRAENVPYSYYSGDISPTMTSNSAPSGQVHFDAESSGKEGYRCLDKNHGTYWATTNTHAGWVAYTFSSQKTITKYTLECSTTDVEFPAPPGSWTFQGSNEADPWYDDNDWTTLATESQNDWVASVPQTFYANNSTAYWHYRVKINADADKGSSWNIPGIWEWTLHETLSTDSLSWQEMGLYRSAATPTWTVISGDFWYDTTNNDLFYYNGSGWVSLSGGGGTGGEPIASAHIASGTGVHGAAAGQRFLTASETISDSQIPSGIARDTEIPGNASFSLSGLSEKAYSSLTSRPTFGTMASETATDYVGTKGQRLASGSSLPATSSSDVGDLFVLGSAPPVLYRLQEKTESVSTADLIPTMTSNTAPSGTATRSNAIGGSNEAWKALDKASGTYWQPVVGATYPQWCGYGFSASQTITSFQLLCGNTADAPKPPGSWTFEACDPGGSWTVLGTYSQETWATGTPQTFSVTNSTPYTYYRINVSENAGSLANLAVYEMNMFGTTTTTTKEWQETGLFRGTATPTGTIATGTHWYDQNSNKERVWDGATWQNLW